MGYDPDRTQQAPSGQSQYDVPALPGYTMTQQQQKPRRMLWTALSIIGGVIVLGLVAFLAVTLISGLATAGPRNAVDGFYKAYEQQDYATAYTYLDTSGVSIQGQQITQQVFVQASQTIDKVVGPVTKYNITNAQVNNDTATVTVDVTRGTNTMTENIRLRKIGNDWKITGLASPGSTH
ncbi:MAG: DUF4878 domain-containing protein [Ktedonobacteraceae bacterium]|nr:DUF4878 domain-containing protein [Ktedonobacteraceae bacterium]